MRNALLVRKLVYCLISVSRGGVVAIESLMPPISCMEKLQDKWERVPKEASSHRIFRGFFSAILFL